MSRNLSEIYTFHQRLLTSLRVPIIMQDQSDQPNTANVTTSIESKCRIIARAFLDHVKFMQIISISAKLTPWLLFLAIRVHDTLHRVLWRPFKGMEHVHWLSFQIRMAWFYDKVPWVDSSLPWRQSVCTELLSVYTATAWETYSVRRFPHQSTSNAGTEKNEILIFLFLCSPFSVYAAISYS